MFRHSVDEKIFLHLRECHSHNATKLGKAALHHCGLWHCTRVHQDETIALSS